MTQPPTTTVEALIGLAEQLERAAASNRRDASEKDATTSGAAAITGYLFSAVANEMAAEKLRSILAMVPPEADFPPTQGLAGGEMRVVPRKPTDREIGEILYNINRKRSHSELTEHDVREVMDNYFYNVGQPDPVAAQPQRHSSHKAA